MSASLGLGTHGAFALLARDYLSVSLQEALTNCSTLSNLFSLNRSSKPTPTRSVEESKAQSASVR